jgi:multiple sugar transport system permease protein
VKKKKPWVVVICVVLVAIVLNIPLLNTFFTSFKSNTDISSFPPKFFFAPIWDHYKNLLFAAGYNFPSYFKNSILLAVFTCLFVVIITVPSAYSIVRLNFSSKKLLSFSMALRLFPPIVFAIPYYMMFQYMGMLDTVLGLILINTFLNIPLGLLLMVGFLQDIPKEIEESAKIDGCSIYQILWKIIIPLLAPGIASVAILSYIFSWNDYLFAVIISLNHSTPVTLGSTMFITSWGIKWGDISAATVLSILPPLGFTFFAQKYLVSGLSMGAVKG